MASYYYGAKGPIATRVYEICRLTYKPTNRKHPAGWKYAVGPFKKKTEAVQKARYAGGESIRVVECDRRSRRKK